MLSNKIYDYNMKTNDTVLFEGAFDEFINVYKKKETNQCI